MGWNVAGDLVSAVESGYPSGGTAVIAVEQLGLARPAQPPAAAPWPSMTTVGAIEIPGLGTLAVISACGVVKQGLKEDNLEMLATIARVGPMLSLPVIAGGDYNLTPAKVTQTGLAKQGGVVPPL